MAKAIHLDLAEHGFPEQWVELVDPRYLSQRQFTALAERSKDDAKQYLRECVSAWHILDDEGRSLSDPKTDDIDTIPAGILKATVERLSALFNETLPKA